jgi:hypothetical protein
VSYIELLIHINVMYLVTTYLKGGAIEHKTVQIFEKPFPNPYAGSFVYYSVFSDF